MPASTWTPSANPDPSQILHEAVADTRNGQHVDALAKFLWFHHHALQYEQGQYGVRLSFALGYWHDVASVYSPAQAALVFTRDEAESLVREQPDNFHAFHDAAALNRTLAEELRTADLFAEIVRQDAAAAGKLYHVAEPYLIAVGRFQECGPFLDPAKILKNATRLYQLNLEFEESNLRRGPPVPPRTARPHFVRAIANLVALLVLNDRPDEGQEVCTAALEVLDDEEFRTTLDMALTGHFPGGQS